VSAPMPPGEQRSGEPQNIATAIAEVSERATLLIHEEIELVKAEVAEKTTKLIKGAIVGLVAGIFILTALFFVLIGLAWLLYYYLPIGSSFTYFWGFFAMALILVVLGLIAGLIAAKALKRGSPPVPSMAIEEARKIRETVGVGADAVPQGATSSPQPATEVPQPPTEAPQAAAEPPQADAEPDPPAGAGSGMASEAES
jgi:Putative Actinobacterial Holin-X, holin superfamily III